ncbi:MAG: class II fructose-bisphosphate aldolase [Omnitrophica WOR_2 bacterium]
MEKLDFNNILGLLDNSIVLKDNTAEIKDADHLRDTIHRLAEVSVKEAGPRQGMARYVTRLVAQAAGVIPASIHDLYIARGNGSLPPTFTVPAINLRALSFDSARAVFRAAKSIDAGAFIFEIARSEMGYTDQRPAEYVTNVLAAALSEGYTGPVFIQGDHFQVSAKRYRSDPETELQAIRDLTKEAIQAGFYNIDIDTSTLVDLSQKTIPEQQEINTTLTAQFTTLIRSLQPEGMMISVGGEIGEVGGQNSTEEELRAFMDGYLSKLTQDAPGTTGISKISIQTGTSHGGVVLPDGSIARVDVDFDTLLKLSRIAREEYGLGGAVQHGASTLPEDAFGKFVESEAVEVHLATNFMNMMYDRLPPELTSEMYAYLDKAQASERKPGMTDEQFYYKTRKNAIGPFKSQLWNLKDEKRAELRGVWEEQFRKLFNLLQLAGTRQYVEQYVHPTAIKPDVRFYLGEAALEESVSDLAD